MYIGHAGHEEAVGTMAVAPDATTAWSRSTRSRELPEFGTPVALLAQTTLSHRDWADVARRHRRAVPRRVAPGAQRPVLRHHQPPVGAHGHRRTVRCRRGDRVGQLLQHPGPGTLARGAGCTTVVRVNAAEELPRRADGTVDLHGTVGVTAGASAPEELVDQVLAALDPAGGVQEVRLTDEDEYFPPPRNLRDLLTAIDAAGGVGSGRRPGRTPGRRRALPRRECGALRTWADIISA